MEKIKRFLSQNWFKVFLLIVLVISITIIFYWQNQKYQEKMIKFDACFKACPYVSLSSGGIEQSPCINKCIEKYAITLEKYYKWRDK